MKQAIVLGVLLLVSALTPVVADPVIFRGIDVFTTIADGNTFYDFAQNPIPAGFFCPRSAAFSDRVTFQGLPLETQVPGQLRGADTVIERLNDAAFDARGNAVTSIKVRALSLVSIKPIHTACGDFHVFVTLAGEQRATTMVIQQTDPRGGTFSAPLAIDARMLFLPVTGKSTRNLELRASLTLPASPLPWSLAGGVGWKQLGQVVVDTNSDRLADTRLPGTSNFAPGWSPDGFPPGYAGGCFTCEPRICHTDPATQEQHCTGPVVVCQPACCP